MRNTVSVAECSSARGRKKVVYVVFVSGWVLTHDRYINFNNHYLVHVSAFTAEDVGVVCGFSSAGFMGSIHCTE